VIKKAGWKTSKITDMQAFLQRKIDHDNEIGMPAKLIVLEQLEKDGGKCPECKKPWNKVEVNNVYADFFYYDPDCNCFPRCPECGTSQHREWAVANAVYECSTCRYQFQARPKKDHIEEYSKRYLK